MLHGVATCSLNAHTQATRSSRTACSPLTCACWPRPDQLCPPPPAPHPPLHAASHHTASHSISACTRVRVGDSEQLAEIPLFLGEASCVCSCIGDPLKAESCVTDSIPPQVPARLGRRGRRGGAQAAPADQRCQEWNLVGRRCPVTTVWHCSGQIGQSTQTVVFTVVFQTRALAHRIVGPRSSCLFLRVLVLNII